MKIGVVVLACCLFVAQMTGFGQKPTNCYLKTGYQIVYGKNYMYQVKSPNGYNAQIQLVSSVSGHVKFIPNSIANSAFEFYIISKNSDSTADQQKYLSSYYQDHFSGLQVSTIETVNLPFQCTAKCYSQSGKFYDYLYYINCGTKYNYWVVASMHSEKKPISTEEYTAFYNTMLSINPIK